jgi:hypothetical protein
MKKHILAGLAAMACLSAAQAQQPATGKAAGASPAGSQTPPPVYQQPSPTPVYVYDQRPLPQQPVLISPQQAQAVVDEFRTNYGKLGSPRILIYVNRDLVDDQSGIKLTARNEKVDTTHTETTTSSGASTNAPDKKDSITTHTAADNRYSNGGKATPTLADRQTVRDVERLIGRPLRAAGVTVVDQRVAASLIGNRPLDSITTESEQARKDREAVSQIADVALEVLISSRNITMPGLTADRTYTVPDIQMTALRLKDAKVMGQAAASDVMNTAGGPVNAAQHFTVQDITEGTALALMEDMLQETK